MNRKLALGAKHPEKKHDGKQHSPERLIADQVTKSCPIGVLHAGVVSGEKGTKEDKYDLSMIIQIVMDISVEILSLKELRNRCEQVIGLFDEPNKGDAYIGDLGMFDIVICLRVIHGSISLVIVCRIAFVTARGLEERTR